MPDRIVIGLEHPATRIGSGIIGPGAVCVRVERRAAPGRPFCVSFEPPVHLTSEREARKIDGIAVCQRRSEGSMSKYRAEIRWERAGETFVDNGFSRRHAWTFDGGASVPASSSPDIVPEPMSDGAAVDPEEALVAALSSCHMLWFLSIAASRSHVVDSYRDQPVGIMDTIDGRRRAITEVTLRPEVRFAGTSRPAREEVEAMHRKAHENCFIANSIKAKVVLAPVLPEA